MTRDEFIILLKSNNIDPSIVNFNNNTSEGYCIRKNHFRWETLFRERGIEYNILGYPSESDALISMLDELINIYSKINTTII